MIPFQDVIPLVPPGSFLPSVEMFVFFGTLKQQRAAKELIDLRRWDHPYFGSVPPYDLARAKKLMSVLYPPPKPEC